MVMQATRVTSCEPFKNTQIPDLGPRDDGTEHALACLAARWRILYCIVLYSIVLYRTSWPPWAVDREVRI